MFYSCLLELARLLAGTTLSRTVRFVAFANEEAPYFYGDEMGSDLYATRAHVQGERIAAMMSLETSGYYTGRCVERTNREPWQPGSSFIECLPQSACRYHV